MHYICTGSCHSEYGKPGICEEKFCTMEGRPLKECDCDDGMHSKNDETTEEEEDEENFSI